MHHPVLLQTVLEWLGVKKNGLYVDATVGEGNLTEAILKSGGKVLALDWDEQQINQLKKRFEKEKNLILVNENFANLEKIARQYSFYPVDAIVFDLGLSMDQLEKSNRGFSFKKKNEFLDMRINQSLKLTASDVLNNFSKEKLYDSLCRFGEDVNTKKIVEAIEKQRKRKRFEKVGDLIEVIDKALGKKDEKTYRRIFQALRMIVNHEIENLKEGLKGAVKIAKPEGKIIVISFHSVESRVVKQFIVENKLKKLTKKVIKGEREAQLRVFSPNKNV